MIVRICGEVFDTSAAPTEAYLDISSSIVGGSTVDVSGLPAEAFDWREFINTSVDTFVEFVKESVI